MISYDTLKDQLCVKEYSNYFITHCVFHDDTNPSLLVYENGWFKCLGCNRAGRFDALWKKMQGVGVIVKPDYSPSYRGPSLQEFSDMEELCYSANRDLINHASFQWYLKMRGLADRIELNDLGYWKGWYSIPVYNEEREFVTAVFRSAPHVQEATGMRYWMNYRPVLYVPDWTLAKRSKYLFVVYGMLDALTLVRQRFPVVTSTGGQNFTPEWLDDFRKEIIIFPDAGEESQGMYLADQLGWRGRLVRLPYPEKTKDFNDVLVKYGESAIERLVGQYVVN